MCDNTIILEPEISHSLQTASSKPESASACPFCCQQHWAGERVHFEAGGPYPGLITDVIKRTCVPFTTGTRSPQSMKSGRPWKNFRLHTKTFLDPLWWGHQNHLVHFLVRTCPSLRPPVPPRGLRWWLGWQQRRGAGTTSRVKPWAAPTFDSDWPCLPKGLQLHLQQAAELSFQRSAQKRLSLWTKRLHPYIKGEARLTLGSQNVSLPPKPEKVLSFTFFLSKADRREIFSIMIRATEQSAVSA